MAKFSPEMNGSNELVIMNGSNEFVIGSLVSRIASRGATPNVAAPIDARLCQNLGADHATNTQRAIREQAAAVRRISEQAPRRDRFEC